MPSESGPAEQQSGLRIAVAPVVEFHFGLFLITKHTIDPEKTVPSWVVKLTEAHGDLVRRFGAFWSDRGLYDLPGPGRCYREHGELLVAAWRSGMVLSEDVKGFLAELPLRFSETFATPPLESEPAEIWNLVDGRLAYLRGHAEDRAEYCRIVTELWNAMRPEWNTARAAAERAARDLTIRARTESDPRALVPGNTFLHKDEFQAQIANARARGEFVIIPLGLAGAGQLFWTMPGITLIGVGLERGEREEQRRERSERAAGRFKVLSDPTRVAILFELLCQSNNASTVTELASLFRLSQPTVSVHIKLLREAGLIRAERDGNQVHYQAEDDVVRRYVDEAVEDMVGTLYPGAAAPALRPVTA
jgi:DNA-binding transcriptional ArsR family regulator